MSTSFLHSYSLIATVLLHVCSSQATCGGNSLKNASCVFPFMYGDISWEQCTSYSEQSKWCSTTSDYDTDGEWRFCDCSNITPAPIATHIDITTEASHFAFTRGNLNDGVLKTMIVRLLFANESKISEFEWLNYSAPSISQFYTDSSWNKLNYSFTLLDQNYQTDLNVSTVSLAQIALEAFRLAEQDGYIWCKGICGTSDHLRRDTQHYDQFVVAVHDRSSINRNTYSGWAGKGTYSTPKTWVKSNYFDPAVVEHEFGHNLGLAHQYTTKYLRIDDIGDLYDGESRMAGGGTVYSDSETSRFKRNGHFGPCAKDWFGWLEPDHIITLSRHNISSGTFTLNAFDRPDVIPNDAQTIAATDSNIFLLRVQYGSQFEYVSDRYLNSVYIYYRTSYAGEDSGASIQYCLLSKSDSDSGSIIQTFTYDAHGDTYTQKDHYVNIGESFVIEPMVHSLEGTELSGDTFVNPLLARMNVLNVTVLSVGDGWKDCDKETYICNVSHPNISITVRVEFISDEKDIVIANNTERDPMDVIDSELYCSSDNVQRFQMDTNQKKYHVIRIQSEDEIGVYGRGLAEINFCATDAHVQAFVFDEYPYNLVHDDLGIGSLMSYTFGGNVDNSYSCSYPHCKIKAVQVVQNEDSWLHIAEMEVFSEINGTNIANESVCFSFPSSSGDMELDLVDGDMTTFSHSTDAMKGSFDICVFDEGVSIQQVKIWPRDAWWDRSNNLTVNLWRTVHSRSRYILEIA